MTVMCWILLGVSVVTNLVLFLWIRLIDHDLEERDRLRRATCPPEVISS